MSYPQHWVPLNLGSSPSGKADRHHGISETRAFQVGLWRETLANSVLFRGKTLTLGGRAFVNSSRFRLRVHNLCRHQQTLQHFSATGPSSANGLAVRVAFGKRTTVLRSPLETSGVGVRHFFHENLHWGQSLPSSHLPTAPAPEHTTRWRRQGQGCAPLCPLEVFPCLV